MTMSSPWGTQPELPPGLYDHLVAVALKTKLDGVGNPPLAELADVDAEDAHTAIAGTATTATGATVAATTHVPIAAAARRCIATLTTASLFFS